MAIDKIKLRHLAKDKDERLFEEGDILDALNVNISADVESSGGVVKNVNSTIPGTPSTTEDSLVNVESRVIGSVSDDANGMVYFFVWTALKKHQTIYQYRSSDETYRIVLRSNQFDFQEHGFVNAVVINGEFEADDTPQTIVYFTDNHNPPRKINVDRAFSIDFNLYSDAAVKEFLSVIKSPSSFAPTTELSTDAGRTTNGLYGKVFQFATQYVYKDGEESSISPHSKITHTKYMSLQGINSANIDQTEVIDDNLVLLNTRFVDISSDMSQGQVEIKKLKVLVRFNNSGSWFLVDEFDPNQDLVEADPHSNGSTNTLYTASTGVYKFYNDGLYPSLLASKTDKIYNDVPQKTTSQAIVGNRLMYSSPESGYPNVEATATLRVSYLPEPTVGSFESSSVQTNNSILHHNNSTDGWFNLDFSSANLPVNFTANTQISLTVEYKPTSFIQYGFYNQNPGGQGSSSQDLPLLKIIASDPNDPSASVNFFCGEVEDSSSLNAYSQAQGSINCSMNPSSLNWGSLVASITLTESKTKEQVLGMLANKIKQQTVSYSFNGGSDLINWKLRSSGSATGSSITHELFAKKFDFDIAFTEVLVVNGSDYDGSGSSNALQLYPKAGNFVFPTGQLGGEYSSVSGLSPSSEAPYVSIRNTSSQQGIGFIGGNLESVESFYSGLYSPRLLNGIDTLVGTSDYWADYTLSPDQVNGAKNSLLTSLPLSTRRTFKAGCVHEFGIVYFDEYGRPGYVNEIGSTYVHPFADVTARSDGSTGYNQGPCNISVDMTSAPPTWAKTYQIVYPGMGTFKRFETYTVGGGFKKTSPTSDNSVYLSLNTLKGFQSEKGAIKDYSYTEGDRLRVVKYRNAADTADVYPSEEIMYDVNGIEVLSADAFDSYSGETGNLTTTNKVGTFLKIELPGGNPSTGDFSNDAANLWKNSVVVEILTPRKEAEEKIYYEVGEPRRIFKDFELSSDSNNNHNDGDSIVLQEGDVHYRPMSMLSPSSDALNGFEANFLDNFSYKSSQVESMDVSDFVSSRVWSKGRAHVKYEKADTINYYNRIVYSEEYGDDIGGLTFSSFNPGALSYKNLPKNYGAINFIGNYNQSIAALQENKLSFIPVHRNIIEYADGASSITVSKEVMGDHKESSGDFGCGEDRSSVLIRDGIIFFADKSRQKILAAAGGKLKAISDVEMSSFFEDEFDSLSEATGDGGRLVSGFDPVENMYLFTIEPKTNNSNPDYLGVTVGYSISKGRWISRYSFVPSNYASIDNKLISTKWYQNQSETTSFLFNAHTDPLKRNEFYGTPYSSSVTVVSKISPSKPKVFNALSYEGNSSSWSISSSGISTNLNQSAGGLSTWSEKEGSYYAAMPRDTSSNSTSQEIYIGDLTTSDDQVFTSTVRLNRLPIPVGVAVTINGQSVVISSISGNTLTLSATNEFVAGNNLSVSLSSDNGDPIRGHFAKITMNNAQATAHELYCINTHITESKANHAKGQ